MSQILNADVAFSAQERQELVNASLPDMRRRARVVELIESANPGTRQALRPELDQLNARIKSAWNEYQRRLPILALSRCPFTGEVWSHSFDPYGLDGLWWNCYQPIRPMDEPNGGRFYAFRGAVQADAEPPVMPFLAEPGPEVPYLIARLLQFPTIVAVISHTRLGDASAYPIVYYSSSDLPDESRTNDWGTDFFSFRGEQGYYEQRQYFDAEDEYLYDLKPWIESKRVQWIAKEDDALKIQTGVTGCPYLELPGKRAVWRVKEGKIWWGPPGK